MTIVVNRLCHVGFDFDEPIYPWNQLAHAACIKAGLCAPDTPQPNTWAPNEVYGCTPEEWYAVIDHEIEYGDMYHQPLDPDKVAMINSLYDAGLGVHIITARGHFGPLRYRIRDITMESVNKAGLKFHTLNFAKDKVPTALSLGVEYFVDDHPKYHDPLTEAGVNSFLLDAPYNQDHPEKWYPEGNRVHSTEEFIQIVRAERGL